MIFCDDTGANLLFGEFLGIIGLDLASLIECVQGISKYLLGDLVKMIEWGRMEGANIEEKLSLYEGNEEMYAVLGGSFQTTPEK